MDRDPLLADHRRIADYLRSVGDLTDYFRACRDSGDLTVAESALRDMPEWATFHEVRSALGAAGLGLYVSRAGATGDRHLPDQVDRRRGPRTH